MEGNQLQIITDATPHSEQSTKPVSSYKTTSFVEQTDNVLTSKSVKIIVEIDLCRQCSSIVRKFRISGPFTLGIALAGGNEQI